MTEIRFARSEDIPALCKLLQLLFSAELQFEPNEKLQAKGLRQILGNPTIGDIIIACDLGIPVGMICLLYTVSTARGGKAAILEDFIVRDSHRNQGIGHALLKKAIDHARNSGCLRITLLTDQNNTKAQKIYRDFGFACDGMIPMRKQL